MRPKLYRTKNMFHPRINIINDGNGNLLADPQNILNRWKNFFNQVLNVLGIHDVRQMDIHTAEPLVPEPSIIEMHTAIGKLKSYKSSGTDQIPAKLMKAGGETLYFVITDLFVLHGIRRNCHRSGRNLLLYQFIKRGMRLIAIIIEESPSYQLPTKFYLTFFWSG
jgi:prolipoprotein diacylglyceryltransferase